jgi:hypothetical protein
MSSNLADNLKRYAEGILKVGANLLMGVRFFGIGGTPPDAAPLVRAL